MSAVHVPVPAKYATLRLDTYPDDRRIWAPDIIEFQPVHVRFIVGGAYSRAAMSSISGLPWHVAMKFQYDDVDCKIDGVIDACSIVICGNKQHRRIVLFLHTGKIRLESKAASVRKLTRGAK